MERLWSPADFVSGEHQQKLSLVIAGPFAGAFVVHRVPASPTILSSASAALRSQFSMGGFSSAVVDGVTECSFALHKRSNLLVLEPKHDKFAK
jgi:hypothetical protein